MELFFRLPVDRKDIALNINQHNNNIPTTTMTGLLVRLILLSYASLPFYLVAGQEADAAPSKLRRQTQERPGLVTPLDEDSHIIGGVDAQEGEFPFYVKFEGNVLCGGSLISPNRVLTAGHCIQSNGWPKAVRVGPTNRDNGEVVDVECGVVHPQYLNPFITVLADVAVLKLKRNVTTVKEFVQLDRSLMMARNGTMSPTEETSTGSPTESFSSSPSETPTGSPTETPSSSPTGSPTTSPTGSPTIRNNNFVELNVYPNYPYEDGQPLTVIGFGRMGNGQTSSTLKKVGTYFVSREKCVETYNAAILRPGAHICGDVPNKGDCNGDSGGPLMDENKVQVGVVSFGYGGCASDYQDVYAKVSTYVDWIREQMEDDYCPAGQANGGGGGGVFDYCFAASKFVQYAAGAAKDSVFGFFNNN